MSGFRENGAKNRKSVRAMFSALLSPNFMPSFEKIVGAVFEICRSARTDGLTHGGYFTAPFGFQPGTNNAQIEKVMLSSVSSVQN